MTKNTLMNIGAYSLMLLLFSLGFLVGYIFGGGVK